MPWTWADCPDASGAGDLQPGDFLQSPTWHGRSPHWFSVPVHNAHLYCHCNKCKSARMEKSPHLSQHRSSWYCPLVRYNTLQVENTFLMVQVINFLQATRCNFAPGGLMQYWHTATWDLLSQNVHELLVSWQLLSSASFRLCLHIPLLHFLVSLLGRIWVGFLHVFLQQCVAALKSMSQFSGWWTSDVNGQSYLLGGLHQLCATAHTWKNASDLAAIPASKNRGAQRVWQWVGGLGSCSSTGSVGYFPRQVAWVPGPAWHHAGLMGGCPSQSCHAEHLRTWGYKQLFVYAQHLFKSTC